MCLLESGQLLQAVIDMQDIIKKTGTVTGKEFQRRTLHEGPVAVKEQPSLPLLLEFRARSADPS